MTPAEPAASRRLTPRELSAPRPAVQQRVPRAAAASASQVARQVPQAAARSAMQVARRVPRRQSLAVQINDARRQVGQTELGRIDVADTVVAKIASRAAIEVPDVGAAPSGLLGKLGAGSSEIGALPSTKATVDGQLAFVDLTLSVRYPVSVRASAAAVREQVRNRVGELAGLQVPEVNITVAALVADLPARRRVQ